MKKISMGTWARTGALILAIVNQILTSIGKNPLPWSETEVYEAITIVFTVITSIIAWWKNNSFTKNAIEADDFKKSLNGADPEEGVE